MRQKGFFQLIPVILVLGLMIVVGVFIARRLVKTDGNYPFVGTESEVNSAVKAGKQLSSNQCEGEGVPYMLSVSPMKFEDFSHIEPYGLMIGGHVTPIDHQYFSPTIFNSPKDTYDVYAMADSKLVNVESHPTRTRLIFSVSCTFFYYYDLLTSLAPGINDKNLPIDVKAGQVIGKIGGQTLDFAVWDTTKPLTGFIVPDHYSAEPWKIYTVDPLSYYTPDLKKKIVEKYVRTVEPISGKIDYDIDGKIIGNWFEEGTLGYGGKLNRDDDTGYWKGHLSFVPQAYDPSAYIVSVGFLAPSDGRPENQFSILRSAPKPETIGVNEGLIKYELRKWQDVTPNGEMWNHMELIKGPRLVNENQPTVGCALFQLMEARKLKFEIFQGRGCESINGFTSKARSYLR